MFFADEIILIDKIRDEINVKAGSGFKLSKVEIEYLKCKFSNDVTSETGAKVRCDTHVIIQKKESFEYFASTIKDSGKIDEDI